MCLVMETLGHADFQLKRLRDPADEMARVTRGFGSRVGGQHHERREEAPFARGAASEDQ